MRRDFDALYLRSCVRGAENYGGRMIRWSKSNELNFEFVGWSKSNERIFALVGWSKGKFPHSVEGDPADILGAASFVRAMDQRAKLSRLHARAAVQATEKREHGRRARRGTRRRFVVEWQDARTERMQAHASPRCYMK